MKPQFSLALLLTVVTGMCLSLGVGLPAYRAVIELDEVLLAGVGLVVFAAAVAGLGVWLKS